MLPTSLLLLLSPSIVTASLIADYTAPKPASYLGNSQIEKGNDYLTPAQGGDKCYITPGLDPQRRPALHLHRNPEYRRAEVSIKADYQQGKTYYMGYEFMLKNVHEGMMIMQWKKGAAAEAPPAQNIPFNLEFSEHNPPRLSLTYTEPGKKRTAIWTSSTDFSVSTIHNLALMWDTTTNARIHLWMDGKSLFQKAGLNLWSGDTHAKVGMYGGQKGSHDTPGESNTFDSWIYRVQISDASLNEIADSSGLGGLITQGRVKRSTRWR